MIKKSFFAIFCLSLFFGACKSDDVFNDIPIDQRNTFDDNAITDYLKDHYFDEPRGLIKAYKDSIVEDEDHPSLLTLGTKLSSGVWVIKRPGVEAEGPHITDNSKDSILISLNSFRFRANYDDLEEGEKAYTADFASFVNTIHSTGTPVWDPSFYYVHIPDDQREKGLSEKNYVISGFVEGLKHFNSTMTDGVDVYNFQGVIVVPSRAAYAREIVYINGIADPMTYRDNSFIFNFELHKFKQRKD